jgi:putative transposase
VQNGFIESFNGRMRDELLNETMFSDLNDARAKIAHWVADYNIRRPHSSLKYLTPAAYAAHLTATDDRLPTPTSSADRPLLHPRKLLLDESSVAGHYLNRISASVGGASAGVRPPSGLAAG